MGSAGVSCGLHDVGRDGYADVTLGGFVEQDQPLHLPPVFKTLPSKFGDKSGDCSFRALIAVGHKSGCFPLNHLDLLFLGLCVWVPDGASVLDMGSDQREVGLLFDAGRAAAKISPDKSLGSVCLCRVVVEVVLPVEVFG